MMAEYARFASLTCYCGVIHNLMADFSTSSVLTVKFRQPSH
jgi:hypothetical protein